MKFNISDIKGHKTPQCNQLLKSDEEDGSNRTEIVVALLRPMNTMPRGRVLPWTTVGLSLGIQRSPFVMTAGPSFGSENSTWGDRFCADVKAREGDITY